MVRLGIIGCGNMGKSHVRRATSGEISRLKLTAVCDIDPKQIKSYKDKEGVKCFTDSRELIRSGEVDAVLIATPHYFHTTIGIDALQQGLHVLTEKPISVHKADAERLIAAHTNKKQVFAAMFNQRTDPRYKGLKKLIASGELGPVQRVNLIVTDWFRSYAYYASGGWRATWEGEGGGVLLNQCPHTLDLFQWICGMPTRVRATCNLGKYHDIEVEDEVTAYMEFANGATGVFVTSTGECPGTNRWEVAGDRGKVVLEAGSKVAREVNTFLRFTRNEIPTQEYNKTSKDRFGGPPYWNVEVPVEGKAGQHSEVVQNFVNAILDGKPLIAPAEEGIRSVELANAMLYSSLTDKAVDLPLDGAAFEAMLKELIAKAKGGKKKTVIEATDDLTKSFGS